MWLGRPTAGRPSRHRRLRLICDIQSRRTSQTTRTALTAKARIVLKILPLLLVPVFAAAVAYWLTRSRAAAVTTGAVVLGAMLFIGITS
jgi:hypothetical protein